MSSLDDPARMDGNQVDNVVPLAPIVSPLFPPSIAPVGESSGIRSTCRNARFLVLSSKSEDDQHQARPAEVHLITINEAKLSLAHRIAVADNEATILAERYPGATPGR